VKNHEKSLLTIIAKKLLLIVAENFHLVYICFCLLIF